ncbi:uncharacterized protein LOC143034276 [Oratosquilla oratoria]|uniref:uncharacterized protein LOC143034276 n=1 Tax=Oratosquilla oratoria TaxID=337810 RepID=UPI003F763A42
MQAEAYYSHRHMINCGAVIRGLASTCLVCTFRVRGVVFLGLPVGLFCDGGSPLPASRVFLAHRCTLRSGEVEKCRSVSSATDFIDLLRTAPPCHDIASLDAESLFTNVPVDETINIILDRVYRSDLPALNIPEYILKAMLETCTKEAPFLSHRGELFKQVDGVAMGSPLGVLFANMYMAQVEKKVFNHHPPPGLYARYIDDIFITTSSDEDANSLLTAFQNNSCLTFTCEQSEQKRLPFLDIDITKDKNGFKTKVYTKDTNVGRCLNARGECPPAYKRSVAAAYINRALTRCSSWTETRHELERIRQLLTNNGYPDEMIEGLIRKKLDHYTAPTQTPVSPDCKITIYYQSSYHDRYKDECDAIRGIIKRGVTPTHSNNTIDLRINAKPNLTRSLFMRNNTAPRTPKEASTNVIYEFSCQESRCDGSNTYIDRTSTT